MRSHFGEFRRFYLLGLLWSLDGAYHYLVIYIASAFAVSGVLNHGTSF